MNKTQATLGNSLLKSLIGLRESKGEIRIEDVGQILQGMASSLQQSQTAEENFLKKEIEKMAQQIVAAKQEIAELTPGKEEDRQHVKSASMELSEVVRHTEKATNEIMDATDEVQAIAAEIGDKALADRIIAASTKIYDACNFQDITGQRINKVLRLLEDIEARIARLILLFHGTLPEGFEPPKVERLERRG